jgi:hypothetical protein
MKLCIGNNMYRAPMDASSVSVMLEKLGSSELFVQNTIRDCIYLCIHLSPFKFKHQHSNAMQCLPFMKLCNTFSLTKFNDSTWLSCKILNVEQHHYNVSLPCKLLSWERICHHSDHCLNSVIILWKACKCMVVFRTWHRNVIE